MINNEKSTHTSILNAARAGDIETVRTLLSAGAPVDARGEALQITPLMIAAGRGDAAMVRLLLEAGANPNATGRNGASALARAIVGGSLDVATLLIDAGANPSGTGAKAAPNTAPLWVAVVMKRRPFVELLLARGAEVNIGDRDTDTLFGVAVVGGDAEIARLLLDAGADPTRAGLANLPLQAVSLRFTNPAMAELLETRGLSLAREGISESGW